MVLQGQSLEPTSLAGYPANFDLYAKMFGDLATDAGARTVLFVTWARAPGDPSTYPILFDNPPEMQDDLTTAYDAASQAIPGSLLACAGPAFRQAITQHPEITLQQADFSHPTVAGTYLAASTFYVALTGHPVPETSFVPDGLSAADAATLRGIAQLGSNCAHAQFQGVIQIHDQNGSEDVAYDGDGGPFEFGTAGSPISAPFYVINWGGTTVELQPGTLSAPFQWTGGAFPGGQGATSVYNEFDIPYCTTRLAPNQSCALSVTFDGSQSGTGSISLGLTHAYTSAASRRLQGTATARALLSMNIWPEPFGACLDSSICGYSFFDGSTMGVGAPLNGSAPVNVYVINRGALPTTSIAGGPLSAPYSWGSPDAGGFPGGTGGIEYGLDAGFYPYCSTGALGVGEWCVVTASFSPTQSGLFDANLELVYSDSQGPVTPNAGYSVSGGIVQNLDGGSPWGDFGDGGLQCESDAGCLPP